ncbi:HD-GYP domain-containing protein [Paenibacillus sp. MBLB4367]|uniref:HD-GYP domain-containing protein n=1 Tax=Paenibacillus sp. MBLB4367 TaxID=3384767 RepID=UPI00390800CB
MRLLPIGMCQPGMRLGKSIYNEEGIVLLGCHVELTQSLLERLMRYGIDFLYIDDPRTDDVEISELLSDETRLKAMQTIRGNFRKVLEESTRRSTFHSFLGKEFGKLINLLVDDLSASKAAMIMLTNMQLRDHYLYQHSLNVCIYSTMLGMFHGYSRDELTVLSLGAILHDVGKVHVPLDILQKPGKLTEQEFDSMKQHTGIGFKLLKEEPNIPLQAAHCAYQHHERVNGSGYPRGLKGRDIHEYARWIGIADSYDAMTTSRVYRRAMLPHQALETLFTGSDTLYDHDKVETFRDKIAIYPIGVTVTLNTGESGVVVDLNANSPQRPIVRILHNEAGEDLTVPYEIDLSKKLNLVVTSVFDAKVQFEQ